jgi:hypothetical protein
MSATKEDDEAAKLKEQEIADQEAYRQRKAETAAIMQDSTYTSDAPPEDEDDDR